MTKITSKQIDDFIYYIEEKLDLHNVSINNIKIWSAVRLNIWYKLYNALHIFEGKTESNTKQTIKEKIKSQIRKHWYLYSILIRLRSFRKRTESKKLHFPDKSKIEYLLIATGISRYGRDIYCEDLCDILQEKVLVIDPKADRSKLIKDSFSLSDVISYYNKKFHHLTMSAYLNSKFYDFENECNSYFNLDINFFHHFYSVYKLCCEYYDIGQIFNDYPNIKKMFIVCAYGEPMGLIKSAHEHKIEVIELQHGIIAFNHLGYHYPDSSKVDGAYFPDKIYLFGKYHYFAKFSSTMKPIVFGAQKIIREFYLKQIEEIPKTILVIGQGLEVGNFFKMTYEIAALLPDYNIKYILHPSEIMTSEELILHKNNCNNLTVYNNFDINVYQLMKETEYVISRMSTLCLEATLFQKKLILLDIDEEGDAIDQQSLVGDGAAVCTNAEEIRIAVLNNKGQLNKDCQFKYYEIKEQKEMEKVVFS